MGRYVNKTPNEQKLGLYKTKDLVNAGASLIDNPPNWDEIPSEFGIVCITRNGFFEAVAYMYSEIEYKYWLNDSRDKTWLYMDKAWLEENAE